MKNNSRTGAALVVTLSLLILLTICILAFISVVHADRQSAALTAATIRAEILGRSAGNLVLSDLISEIRDGSTNLGTASAISYTARTNQNMLPQRILASTAMATNTNFANLYKQSLPVAFCSGVNYTSNGPARAAGIGTWEASRNGRVLSVERWNKPSLLFGKGFSSTNELPQWIYFTRRETYAAAQLNPTAWSTTLTDSRATNSDFVIGRAAYNVYEIGGCLDLNVAGGVAGTTKQQLLASLSGAALTNLPGMTAATVVTWRNASTGTNVSGCLAYATNTGLKAGFLVKPNGDRRFFGRQDLIAYAQTSTNPGFTTNTLPYLTHFTRGVDRPSTPATTSTNLLSGYPIRPSGVNPAPLSLRWAESTTLPDGTKLNAGDPVAFRRFPLRRLALLTEDATATQSDTDAIYRSFGLSRNSPADPWVYNHGASNRILTLSEVRDKKREPDFFEMLQAAIISGSLGGSVGPDNSRYAADTDQRDKNIYTHVLQIGASLIDQYDTGDYPTQLQILDGDGKTVSIYGIENLPYINEIGTLPYRPAALPRTTIRGYLQFEVWNPHQNAVNADANLKLRVAATKGKIGLGLKQASVSGDPSGKAIFDPQYNQVLIARYNGSGTNNVVNQAALEAHDYYFKPGPVVAVDGAVDFSATPGYLEFRNSAQLREPKTLTAPNDPVVNSSYPHPFAHPVLTTGSNSPNSIVSETTPDSIPLPEQTWQGKSPAGAKLDLATEINFAGIMAAEREVPDDRADGVPDRTSWGVPAETCWHVYTMSVIGSVLDNSLTIELQVDTPQGWKTYQKIQNLKNVSTSNRYGFYTSQGALTAQKASWVSFLRPYSWPKPDKNASPQLTLFTGYSTLFSFDPRTSRFGLVLADLPGTDSDGSQDKFSTNHKLLGNGGDWMPSTTSDAEKKFGALAANISNHPSGQQYYKDPDGILRRADGEERTDVPASDQVYPMKSGYSKVAPYGELGATNDRPLILNRPFNSVAEMGYAFRDLPWKSLDFWSADSGDGALLDYFCIEETALDHNRHPLRAGTFNPNTASTPALEAVIRDALARQLEGSPTGDLTATQAGAIATNIRSAITTEPLKSVAGLPRLADGTTFPSATSKILRKTEKEAFIRALAPMADPNAWNVLVDVIAQSGRFPPNASGFRDFIVQGEARYWVFASIDRSTGEILDMQYELVTE